MPELRRATGNFVNASGLVRLGENRTFRVRYQRRQMNDVGFPDFAPPYFFNATSLPQSDLDRVSARYEARAVTPWLANLSLTAHYQQTERLLRNLLPVQFPAPTPVAFFPDQRVSTRRALRHRAARHDAGRRSAGRVRPVVEARADDGAHLLSRSQQRYANDVNDDIAGGTGGAWPARTCTDRLSRAGASSGPPPIAHPVRVPDASFRDIAIFAQDEWRVMPNLSLVAGLRGDFYNVTTEPTPGYDVASVVAGANPPVESGDAAGSERCRPTRGRR